MSSKPTLGGRYRLLDRLGGGGMSVVWRAYDQVLRRTVALKLLASESPSGARPELVRTEARTAAQLSHPHICQVYDYGEYTAESGEHVAYIVMELLSGSTLEDRLRAGRLPVRTALRVGAQVASALAAAHGCGLVHRDVKPANVMMSPTGPKLVDFGIAATAGAPDEHASAGEVWGTPAYLAPERWRECPVTPASDVYALGVVLYRLVSGTVPWPAGTVTEMVRAHEYREPAPLPPIDGLPEPVRELCLRCLATDPDQRPTTHEVTRVLAEAVGWRVDWAGGKLIEADEDDPSALASDPASGAASGDGGLEPDPAGDQRASGTDPAQRYRRKLLVVAAILLAAVAGVAGGIWNATGPSHWYGSDVAAASDDPAADVPATHPGTAGPWPPDPVLDGGPTGPAGAAGGEPPGGNSGTGQPDPQEPAPPAPDPDPPPADPEPSGPPAEPEPARREEVVETPGGTVLASCAESTASVEPLELAPGYRVVDQTRGPGIVRAGIVLGSSEDRVRVDVRCRGTGPPASTVQVE